MECMRCLKYLVFIFNLIFWLCGMAVLGLALFLRFDGKSSDYVTASDQSVYFTGCYILMGAGGLMTIIGFLGCCGAWRENRCMLATFFTFLLIILLMEIAVGVYAYLKREEIADKLLDSMAKFIANDYGGDDARTKAFNTLQRDLECCGANGPDDYRPNLHLAGLLKGNIIVPESCCAGKIPCTTGCGDAIVEWFKDHLLIVMIVGIALGVVEILGLILSMTLCCMLQRRYGGYDK